MNTKLDAILYLPFVPESISWRPYRRRVGPRTLLEWFVEKFRLANPQSRLRVLFHEEDSGPYLDDLLGRAGVSPIQAAHKSQPQAFLQAAAQTDRPHVAFFTIEMGFAPPDLLARAFAHHLRHDNRFTAVAGLPVDCTPEVYDAELLKAVCGAPLPKLPPRLRTLVEQLLFSAQRLSPEAALAPDQTLLRLARALGARRGGGLNRLPLDASAAYGADPADLPEALRVRNAAHLEIARAVTADEGRLDGPLDALRSWKTRSIEKRRADIGELIAAAGDIRRDWETQAPRRVLYVSTPSAYSGAEESLCQLVGGLNRGLYRPHALIGAEGYFAERLRQFGAEVIADNRDFSTNTVGNLFYVLSALKRVKPDVIHINAPSGMPVLLAARLLDVPVVYHPRGAALDDLTEHLKSSDAIIAVSDFIRRELEKKEIEKDRISVIFDGVDARHFSREGFDKAAMREELGLPRGARVALCIARFSTNKRQDLLVAASASLAKTVPDYHLVFVGEAEDQRYFADIVGQLRRAGLYERTTFLPFQRDIRKVEAAADVLVLCCDREALGTCLMESMAMGLPVVVSDSGGSHELFADGLTGLVTKGDDVKGLAAAIEAVLTDAGLARRLAAAARDYAATELTVERHAERVASVYEEVIAARAPALAVSR
jgi:glycosyltransferase involved in cell wall biosynthesis